MIFISSTFKKLILIGLILLPHTCMYGQNYTLPTVNLNYQVKKENHIGVGVSYYSNKSVDVETYFCFGAPYLILGLNVVQGYGKVAVGRQFNLNFSGSVGITKNLEEASGYYFEVSVMQRLYKPIHLSVGFNKKFGLRLGINYII